MNAMETAALRPRLRCARPEADVTQLAERHDAVLPLRQGSDRSVDMEWAGSANS